MSRRGLPKQYVGPLTPAQAAAGIEAAARTAQGLLRDAKLLFENQRWERATALAILAIEESGKTAILRQILIAANSMELKMAWRSYRTHTEKNVSWIFPDVVSRGGTKLEDFRPIFDAQSNHRWLLEAVKQKCLYSNVSSKPEWSSPDQEITAELAKTVVTAASILVRDGPIAMSSEPELKLWVNHLRPVWNGPVGDMMKALSACYAEADAAGVLQGTGTAAEMLDFLYQESTSLKQ